MDSISKSQLLSDKEFNGLFSNVKDLVVVNQVNIYMYIYLLLN